MLCPRGGDVIMNAERMNAAREEFWPAQDRLSTRAFRFAIRIDSNHESNRLVLYKKKSAFRFTITGFCIINNVFSAYDLYVILSIIIVNINITNT